MPVSELEKLRKSLRATVRASWAKEEMIAAQEALRGAAVGTGFAKCLKELMAAGAGGRESFRECQEKANLADAYRELWGKK